MRFQSIQVLVFCFIHLLFFSGSKAQSVPGRNALIPLAVGNSWSYVDTVFGNTTGEVLETSSLTIRIPNSQIITYKGQQHVVYCVVSPMTSSDSRYFWNDVEGLFAVELKKECQTKDINSNQLLCRYPCAINDTWTLGECLCDDKPKSNQEKGEKIECIATNELITTPAGSFHCIVTRSSEDNQNSHLLTYYCPGVGIIAFKQQKDNGIVSMSITLTSYKLEN